MNVLFSGTEFKGPSCRKLYKEKKIYFKQKNPPNKGAYDLAFCTKLMAMAFKLSPT